MVESVNKDVPTIATTPTTTDSSISSSDLNSTSEVSVGKAPIVTERNFSESFAPTTQLREHIELTPIVHENIKEEFIEEIQPVVHVEREKTEVRQIMQPLIDKDVRPVKIEQRTLATEILPTVTKESVNVPRSTLQSTVNVEPVVRKVVEKPAIIKETERWRIIDEITPVIYKDTIVPTIIRVTKPIREVIVESPIYSEQTLAQREITQVERQRFMQYFNSSNATPNVEYFQPLHRNQQMNQSFNNSYNNSFSSSTSSTPQSQREFTEKIEPFNFRDINAPITGASRV